MTLSPKIRTWKQLDAELRLIGTRLFYVNFWTVGGSLSLDNGRIVAHTVKDALVKQAEALLKDAEAVEQSELQKAERGDDNWPADMNDERFVSGRPKLAPAFGHDNLPAKAKARKAAKDTRAAGAK